METFIVYFVPSITEFSQFAKSLEPNDVQSLTNVERKDETDFMHIILKHFDSNVGSPRNASRNGEWISEGVHIPWMNGTVG